MSPLNGEIPGFIPIQEQTQIQALRRNDGESHCAPPPPRPPVNTKPTLRNPTKTKKEPKPGPWE